METPEVSFRSPSIAALAICCFIGLAHAAPVETPASFKPETSRSPTEARVAAYRDYANTQANALVGMAKVLAKAIKHGDVDAAQSSYAPAHRYLKRIEPIARASRDLNARLDADVYQDREADPQLSGFHRIEYGLFTNRSTAGLSAYADQLVKDAQDLRKRVALSDLTPSILVEGVVGTIKESAAKDIAGEEERYSRTDLWDLEANIDGARQVAALLEPQARGENSKTLAQAAVHFATIDGLLAKHKAGCGFKNYDELTDRDKSELKRPVNALADELSNLRATLAME